MDGFVIFNENGQPCVRLWMCVCACAPWKSVRRMFVWLSDFIGMLHHTTLKTGLQHFIEPLYDYVDFVLMTLVGYFMHHPFLISAHFSNGGVFLHSNGIGNSNFGIWLKEIEKNVSRHRMLFIYIKKISFWCLSFQLNDPIKKDHWTKNVRLI